MSDKIDSGAGAPPRRKGFLRPAGGPSPDRPVPHRHLAHVASFRDSPIVFFTACTAQRRKLLACSQCHEILRTIWELLAEHDGWWVGHYILMPDHVHFFARAGNGCAGHGGLGADVEKRQLTAHRGGAWDQAANLAGGLLRSL